MPKRKQPCIIDIIYSFGPANNQSVTIDMAAKQIRVVVVREDGSLVPHGELLIPLTDSFDNFLSNTFDTFGLNFSQVFQKLCVLLY